MYASLFNIRYQHEYYDQQPVFEMDCAWPLGMQKLIRDMGLLLLPRKGEMSVLFDTSRFDRKHLLDLWQTEVLTFYFTPRESSVFYAVTKGLEKLIREHDPKNKGDKKTPKHFRFYPYDPSFTTPLSGVDLPLDSLDLLQTLEDFSELPTLYAQFQADQLALQKQGDNGSESATNKHSEAGHSHPKKVKPCNDIKMLKKAANFNALFVVSVSVDALKSALESSPIEPTIEMHFEASEAHYKYYFTKMDPDKNLQIIADNSTDFEGIDYQSVAEESLGDRSIAAFISTKPLALRWKHDKYFKLVRKGASTLQTVIEKLPHPHPTRSYKHKEPNQNPINVLEAFIN